MNILIKSSNGITQVSADSKLMSQRKVFIEGEINAETACDFLKKIMRSERWDILGGRPFERFTSASVRGEKLDGSLLPAGLFSATLCMKVSIPRSTDLFFVIAFPPLLCYF